ncbi:MAG: hypothetical protein WBN63_05360, partial [Eudoraea sp.]
MDTFDSVTEVAFASGGAYLQLGKYHFLKTGACLKKIRKLFKKAGYQLLCFYMNNRSKQFKWERMF